MHILSCNSVAHTVTTGVYLPTMKLHEDEVQIQEAVMMQGGSDDVQFGLAVFDQIFVVP